MMSSLRIAAAFCALLLGCSLVNAQPLAHRGDIICTSGFVMDRMCLDNEFLMEDQTLRTLHSPDQHTIHCLVDEQDCVDSGYNLLRPRIKYDYRVGWDIDNPEVLLAEARRVGVCETCDNTGHITHGLWVEVVGEVVSRHPPILHLFVAVTARHHSDPTCPAVEDFMPSSAPSLSQVPTMMPSSQPSVSPSEAPSMSNETFWSKYNVTYNATNTTLDTNTTNTTQQQQGKPAGTGSDSSGISALDAYMSGAFNANSNANPRPQPVEPEADFDTCKHYKLCCDHSMCTNNCDTRPKCAPMAAQGVPETQAAIRICQDYFGYTCQRPEPETRAPAYATLNAFGAQSRTDEQEPTMAPTDEPISQDTDFFNRKLYDASEDRARRRLGQPVQSGREQIQPFLDEFIKMARANSPVPFYDEED